MKHLSCASPLRAHGLAPWLGFLVGLLLAAVAALPARAAEGEVDPPGRAGRIAEVQGQAWIHAPDADEWIAAVRNRPVTSGDRLSTERDGRIEVRIGSTVLHVAPDTEVEVVRLDDDRMSLRLHGGAVSARLRTAEAAQEFDLGTDEGRFVALQAGQYRFDRADDTSSATVTTGQARYEADGTALAVQPGQRVDFWKERGIPQYSITDPQRDDFANWVAAAQAREDGSVSTRYVSPEMTGVEDLDRHGRWEAGTEYGAVWIPSAVPAGWAPYRMGHWVWISPWGWTWVDDAPWGFAPFHYGRWVWHRNAWCWAPGRYVKRPVYAPALVAWVGRPGVNVSVRVGHAPTVGWFPLGPREVYVPGYRVSPRYVQNVNVTHVTRIPNVNAIVKSPGEVMANTRYVNRRLPHAVTVVPAGVVERRQPVGRAYTPVNDRTLRDLNRERPRADAPVVAPPRIAPGAPRAVNDPRVSRPGTPRPGGGRDAQTGVPRPPVVTAPRAPGRDDRRDDRPGREPQVVRPTPPPAQPGFIGRPGVEPRRQVEPGPRVGDGPRERVGDGPRERVGDGPRGRMGDGSGERMARPERPGRVDTPGDAPSRGFDRDGPPRRSQPFEPRTAPPPQMRQPAPPMQPARPVFQAPQRDMSAPRVRDVPPPGMREGYRGPGGRGERPDRGERSR